MKIPFDQWFHIHIETHYSDYMLYNCNYVD